jgi:NodT family efflux transporter outer membrane factor (OMF) lipoprotein
LYSLSSTRSNIPTLNTALEAAKNRLAVLIGRSPGEIHAELAEHRPIPVTPDEVAVGIPSDILRQRPDIRQAERQLASQTARIGVAKSELFPKLRLTGSFGLQALETGDLFTSEARTYSYGPGITLPIFNAGAIRNNIALQTARQKEVFHQYEATVLAALEEVENNLTAYAGEQVRRKSLVTAKDAANRAVSLAKDKYKAGLIDFSDVLEAQRSALSFEDELAQSDGSVTINLIRLYKSIGGGWSVNDESTPQ